MRCSLVQESWGLASCKLAICELESWELEPQGQGSYFAEGGLDSRSGILGSYMLCQGLAC